MTSNNYPAENIMSNQDSKEFRGSMRGLRAVTMFLVLLGAGYVSTQVESAVDASKSGTAAVAQAGQQDLAPTAYFPAQYVNQGKTVEEYIQAF